MNAKLITRNLRNKNAWDRKLRFVITGYDEHAERMRIARAYGDAMQDAMDDPTGQDLDSFFDYN